MHVNVQGAIHKKLDDISVFIDSIDYDIHVIAVTEHWLGVPEESFVSFSGYNMVSCFSRTVSVHGGSCIFYRGGFSCIERGDLKNKCEEVHLECSCVEVIELKLIIICIYRTKNGDLSKFFELLDDILYCSNTTRHRVLICGDLNIDLLKVDCTNTKLLDLIMSYGMKQTIFEPTRITAHSETLIDNIFVNFDYNYSRNIHLGISDHEAQLISFDVPNPNNYVKQVYRFRPATQDRLLLVAEKIKALNINNELGMMEDVDVAFEHFLNSLVYYFDMYCPEKKTAKSDVKHKSWVNAGVRAMSEMKRDLYDQYRHGLVDEQVYSDFCKQYRGEIKLAKLQCNRSYIDRSTNKGKAVWQIVNSYTQGNKEKQPGLNIEDLATDCNDHSIILNELNEHIVKACEGCVFNKPLDKIHSDFVEDTMFLYPTTPDEVVRNITSLKNTKSTGPDLIPVNLLKYCRHVIAEPLSILINLCFEKGKYPRMLKKAYVVLLHKKGDRAQVNNYRPLTITSNISKIIEKIIAVRLLAFAEKHKIISNSQNGYLCGRSTARACYQLVEEVLWMIDEGKPVAGLFMDLTKAFDSVNHEKMLIKMQHYGIRGLSGDLLQSFLTDREQCVKIYDQGEIRTSTWQRVRRGVPQGSALGPLLFVLYINDLAGILSGKTILFADDTSVIIGSETGDALETDIASAVENLQGWFSLNDLMLNVEKTKLINFKTRGGSREYVLDLHGEQLTSSPQTNFLGIVLDDKLGWKQHVSTVSCKLAQFCYALRVLAANADIETCFMAYYAYVYSRLRYCVIVWGNSVDVNRVFILQKRTIRSMFRMGVRESCRPVFKKYRILTFYCIYILECVRFVKENPDFFEKYKREHLYYTRHKSDLCLGQTSLSQVRRNVVSQCIVIYNKLPCTIRNLSTKKCLLELRKILVENAFYSLNEFNDFKFF